MMLAWMFCLLLAGKLSSASPAPETGAPAESNVAPSEYMMAFPMDDDQMAEESAQEAVKLLAETLAVDDDDDESTADDKKQIDSVTDEKKAEESQPEGDEPMGILQAELDAEEEAQRPQVPQRPFFKRPKIEELRKILGFPAPEDPAAAKSKPIPQEKPKVFQGLFNKPKPKFEISSQPSPLGGIQLNLRREDRMMRPFGFPMLPLNPLKRDDSTFRPFGIPDLVHAASSLIRRAMVDDNNENDISKDDKEEDDNANENEQNEENEEEDDDDSLMIVPIPQPKEISMERPPLFRRFPIPLPFPVPKPVQTQNNRPRLPFPPLTPVAFFLPIAQQIMQNIRHSQPRSQPPMIPMAPMQHPVQNFIPMQTQIPMVPIHHPMQQQPQPQIFLSHHQPMVPMQQQVVPFIHIMPQASLQMPILTPFMPNMQQQQQRPILRQPRRMPLHAAPQPQQIQRRVPFAPMGRAMQQQPMHAIPQQLVNPMLRRPIAPAHSAPMPRVARPPASQVHPFLFMMPVPQVPMAQQHMPVFQKPPQVPVMPHQRHFVPVPEDERVVYLRSDQDDHDDDQEVLILVPSDDVEVAQRPPMVLQPHPQFLRQVVPSPFVPNPLQQRIMFLRQLLNRARQANRQQVVPQSPNARNSRVVEIVQQQLRIFPAHPHHPQMVAMPQFQRAEQSELHPVYVPYPGPQ